MGSLPRRFARLSGRWERLLYRISAFFVIVMLISQLLMMNQSLRQRLSRVESMEGIPYRGEETAK